ncbi:MAG: hypothetical protein ACI32C_02760 [Candidatus Enteromonas sp.]
MTATPKGREDKNGGIGFAYSKDGLLWEALPSKGTTPDADESGAIVKVDGKYYGMLGRGMEMEAYVSERVDGPYRLCKESPVLLSQGTTYFSRFFVKGDEILVNHHAISRLQAEDGFFHCFMAPLKKAEFFNDSIHLRYWKGNDALKSKGTIVTENFDPNFCFLIEGVVEEGETIKIDDALISYSKGEVEAIDSTFAQMKMSLKERGYPGSKENKILILLKQSVFELYLNEVYFFSYSMAKNFKGNILSSNKTIYQIQDR